MISRFWGFLIINERTDGQTFAIVESLSRLKNINMSVHYDSSHQMEPQVVGGVQERELSVYKCNQLWWLTAFTVCGLTVGWCLHNNSSVTGGSTLSLANPCQYNQSLTQLQQSSQQHQYTKPHFSHILAKSPSKDVYNSIYEDFQIENTLEKNLNFDVWHSLFVLCNVGL